MNAVRRRDGNTLIRFWYLTLFSSLVSTWRRPSEESLVWVRAVEAALGDALYASLGLFGVAQSVAGIQLLSAWLET